MHQKLCSQIIDLISKHKPQKVWMIDSIIKKFYKLEKIRKETEKREILMMTLFTVLNFKK